MNDDLLDLETSTTGGAAAVKITSHAFEADRMALRRRREELEAQLVATPAVAAPS